MIFPVLSYEGKRRDSWDKEKVHNDEIVQYSICRNNTAVISFSADVFTKSSEVCTSTFCLTNDQIYKRKGREESEWMRSKSKWKWEDEIFVLYDAEVKKSKRDLVCMSLENVSEHLQ